MKYPFLAMLVSLAATVVCAEARQTIPSAVYDQTSSVSRPAVLMPHQTERPRTMARCDLHCGLFVHFKMNTYGETCDPDHGKRMK